MRTRSCGASDALHHARATCERSGARPLEAELLHDALVEALLVEARAGSRRSCGTSRLSIDRAELDVAEERDLALDVVGERALGAADEDVRLDSDLHQLAHRVLRRLGLQLARRRDVRHQREVDEDRVLAADVVAELADRLEERQRLDVADRAADLDDHDVVLRREAPHRRLDLVGDVRNHLHRRAEVFAAALLGDDVEVDAARRDVVRLRQRRGR